MDICKHFYYVGIAWEMSKGSGTDNTIHHVANDRIAQQMADEAGAKETTSAIEV